MKRNVFFRAGLELTPAAAAVLLLVPLIGRGAPELGAEDLPRATLWSTDTASDADPAPRGTAEADSTVEARLEVRAYVGLTLDTAGVRARLTYGSVHRPSQADRRMQLHGIGLGIARATPDGFEIVDADVQPLTGAFVPPGGGFQMWGRPFTIPGLTAADLVHAWPVLIADVEITSVSRPPWSAGPDAEQTERPPSRTRHVVHGPRSLLADLIAPRPWTR